MALEQVAVLVVFHQNDVDCQRAHGSKTGVWESPLHFSLQSKGGRYPKSLRPAFTGRLQAQERRFRVRMVTHSAILISHLCSELRRLLGECSR